MTEVQRHTNAKNGLLFGGIIGLIYCISLFFRYNQTSSGPIIIAVITFVFYLVVIAFLFLCGLKRKKELLGFISLKEAFQTIFISILVAEFIYSIFNIIYLKFIDPAYFDKLYASTETFVEKTIKDDTQREEALDKIKAQMASQKEYVLSIKGIVLGYLVSIAITGVCGFFAALIIKKDKPVFELSDKQ